MTHVSFTGKQWREPQTISGGSPTAIAAAIAALRTLGDGDHAWTEPTTYQDAPKAAERIRRAAAAGETIGIIGDYDCDGLTSTAMLTRMLQRRNVRPIVRIPHRLNEGYGAQVKHVEEMARDGVTLLLLTDTGIVATEALTYAKDAGIDTIILDHHAYAELPPAYAILHPNLTSLQAPPAAAGVVLSFLHALEGPTWDDRDTDLALGAIGTIADVVPLTHNNRTMVQEGLAALARIDPASGLGMLRDKSGITGIPQSGDVAFRLSPRLNAAGRMDDALIGLRALLGDEASVETLETMNAERQRVTLVCMDAAMSMVDHGNVPACVCVASNTFPKGIIGLIAGKLAEKFGRPAAAISIIGSNCTASLRGIPGHDIALALRKNADLFTTFGGHAQAGGCSFPLENLDAVKRALSDDVLTAIDLATLQPMLSIDAAINASDATLALVHELSHLAPFGCANLEPIFLVPSVTLTGLRRVGGDLRHLQARAGTLAIIGFGLGHLTDDITGPVDLACRMTANAWNGTRTAQLSIVDIRTTQTGASLPSISKTAITGTLRAEAIL